jgi:hypothetical protein
MNCSGEPAMSVRRFIGYFIALSACSTIAFASSLLDHAPAEELQSQETSSLMPLLPNPATYLSPHKSVPKHSQVALAQ